MNRSDHLSKGKGGRAIGLGNDAMDAVITSTNKTGVKGKGSEEGNTEFFGRVLATTFFEDVKGNREVPLVISRG